MVFYSLINCSEPLPIPRVLLSGAVKRMNKVGIVADVSHCGDMTSLDACTISTAPVLITHSNWRTLTPHPRCKPDVVIKTVAAIGGHDGCQRHSAVRKIY